MKFKKGDTVIYPQHGACIVQGTKKMEAFGATQEYLILRTVINEMTLSVPTLKTDEVGVRPPVNADELEDLVSVLSKPDPRVPSNWSRRFKNHQEKLKSGDVYQVAEVVRNLALREVTKGLSAGEKAMLVRARGIPIGDGRAAPGVSSNRNGRPQIGAATSSHTVVPVTRWSGCERQRRRDGRSRADLPRCGAVPRRAATARRYIQCAGWRAVTL